MIEINLLPGAGKKKASRGSAPKLDLAATFAGLAAKVRDKYLAAAIAAVVIAVAAVGFLYTTQGKRAADLDERLTKAVEDSTHFAAVVADQMRMEAKRDTLLRDLNLIKSIDEDRYVWPHTLDEVSRALPAYTWISSLVYTGAAQSAAAAAATPAAAKKDSTKKAKTRLPTEIPHDTVKFRMMGQTVDIQALTRFMRQLEASPFLGDVQLERSELALADGKEVTQFTISVTYTRPDTAILRRVPLSVSVR